MRSFSGGGDSHSALAHIGHVSVTLNRTQLDQLPQPRKQLHVAHLVISALPILPQCLADNAGAFPPFGDDA